MPEQPLEEKITGCLINSVQGNLYFIPPSPDVYYTKLGSVIASVAHNAGYEHGDEVEVRIVVDKKKQS